MSDDKRDPPIVAREYVCGVNVVDFGDVRVARGFTRRHHSSCRHRQLIYDGNERRIWCKDCERDVEPFDAFKILVEQIGGVIDSLSRREEAVAAAEKHQLRTLAAKEIDKAWGKRSRVPACPCCGAGLFPEDFKRGATTMLGKDYAAAARKKMGRPVP